MNQFQELFDAQKAYFATGITRSYEWRVEQLDRIGRMVSENAAAWQAAMGADFKTASQEQVFETTAEIREAEYQKSQLREWMRPVEAPLQPFLAETGHRAVVYREPYGVALIVGPSNGPLLLLFRPAMCALAAGNTCLMKLSPAATAVGALLLELIPAYFDPRAVTAVTGHRDVQTALLELPFDFIFCTGSTSLGKVVARAAAENLTPVVLELGGQNPALVDETANLADAAKKISWGAMAWGGQWCTSPGYAYVHESIADSFVAEAQTAVTDMFGTNPKANSDYSRIISSGDVKRLLALIDPTKIVTGGTGDPDTRYLDPTILYPVAWTDK